MQAFILETSGNPSTKNYEVSPGHPPYESRARFLGALRGSWFELGVQVGQQAGDLVRWVSDVWWKHHIDTYGLHDTQQALPRYEAQIAALNPNLIQFMKGVAEGAGDALDQSPFADVSSHYHKVLNTNIYDAWSWRHPTVLPWNNDGAQEPACSAFVSVGDGPNKNQEMIAAHNRHCPFNPKCYQIAYVGYPEDGNAYWTITPGSAGAGCQIVNEKGVSLILNAGGNLHQEMKGNAFGVSWFVLFLHVAAYANTAEEAIEMITKGTADYRANTGRNSLLRTGTWNFMISDRTSCAIVETSCDRYAIRRPGEFGELGNYLVMTNHNMCTYSFDKNNEKTDVPMTAYGNETSHESSAIRFWTLMGDLKHHYGEMDVDLAMTLMKGHHQYDKAGNRLEAGKGEVGLQFEGDVTCPHRGGYPDTWTLGSADSKVIAVNENVKANWTLGRPCEWVGPWDAVCF